MTVVDYAYADSVKVAMRQLLGYKSGTNALQSSLTNDTGIFNKTGAVVDYTLVSYCINIGYLWQC